MKEIYLDHASTTYTDEAVLEKILPFFTEKYGNPESLHKKGKEALIAVDDAREKIADILNCRASEIFFTGTGTAANNLSILGFARANRNKGDHLITSNIEHPSVLNAFKQLETEGFKVTYLKVDSEGLINPADFEKAVNSSTIFASIMYANNEIGTVEPIAEIGEICHKLGVILHTDACQAALSQNLDVKKLNVSMMTLNGSKMYGPKGIGALYKNRDIKLKPVIYGGNQESGLRSGTHNTPGIIGIAWALKIAQENKEKENKRLTSLRDKLITELLKIEGSRLNGTIKKRLPNNVNISFEKIDSLKLLLNLDKKGIFCSTGSACSAGKDSPSHVLLAITPPGKLTTGTLRLSLGKRTTEEDIDCTIKTITQLVKDQRNNS